MAEKIKSLEILSIDDNISLSSLLSKILVRCGHRVTTASSGNEGIEKYIEADSKGTPYELVFTDLTMQNGTGVDVTKAVKLKNPNTPVYVITGYVDGKDYARLQQELRELGPDGILQKPFNLDLIKGIAEKVAIGQDHRKFVTEYLAQEAARAADRFQS